MYGRRMLLILTMVALLALGALASRPVLANGVTPTVVSGNPDCADCECDGTEFKIESIPGAGQTRTYSDGRLEVTITVDSTGLVFDWALLSSDTPVRCVLVKGGNQAHLYRYSGGATEGSGLHAPDLCGQLNNRCGISHITFCYDDEYEAPECDLGVTVSPPSAQLACANGQVAGSVTLTASLVGIELSVRARGLAAPGSSTLFTYRWYGNGILIQEGADDTLEVSAPGVYWVMVTGGECTALSNRVTVAGCEPQEPPCVRADVSAIIHGGWNGIPIKAWVGGTEQPTLLTAPDSSGRPAVLWTFYPPEEKTWTVTVVPQLPAGLDPDRWKYQPASASVAIERCAGGRLQFQLVDTKPKPVLLLPVTGGEPAQAWWQGLLQWLKGLLGLR